MFNDLGDRMQYSRRKQVLMAFFCLITVVSVVVHNKACRDGLATQVVNWTCKSSSLLLSY